MSLTINRDPNPFFEKLEADAARKVFDVFWKFADLENQIDWFIADYYISWSNSTKASEFLDNILHNDTLTFDSKINILKGIAKHNGVKLNSSDLHACRTLRNKFAHGRYSCIDEEDPSTGEILPIYFQDKLGKNEQNSTIDSSYSKFIKHYHAAYNQVGELFSQVSKHPDNTTGKHQHLTATQQMELKKLNSQLPKVYAQFSQLEASLDNTIHICVGKNAAQKLMHDNNFVHEVDVVNQIAIAYGTPSIPRKLSRKYYKSYLNIKQIASNAPTSHADTHYICNLKNRISCFKNYHSDLQTKINLSISRIQRACQVSGDTSARRSENLRQRLSKFNSKEQYRNRLKSLAISGDRNIQLLGMTTKTAGTVKSYTFQWRTCGEEVDSHFTSTLPNAATNTTPQLFMRQILINSYVILPSQALSKAAMEKVIVDNIDNISKRPLRAIVKPVSYIDGCVQALVELVDNSASNKSLDKNKESDKDQQR